MVRALIRVLGLGMAAVGLLLGGCGGPGSGSRPTPAVSPSSGQAVQGETGPSPLSATTVTFTAVDDSIPDKGEMEDLIAPYRNRMGEEIREVIGETTGVLAKAVPEGTLGNFAADAMLWAANRHSENPVQMAMTNNGGLRVPIGPGPITLGQMYELMPFENMLSVLVLSGAQLQTLCDELAEMRGEPIAGFSFRIVSDGDRRVARDIRVDGEPVAAQSRYRLVTNDYLANGGGGLTPIHSPLDRQDLPVLLRDAFIEYVRFKGTIEPVLEGRITGGVGR